MDVDDRVAAVASAIGEAGRARMLFALMDGRARTATELAAVAEVQPSTATAHLQRLLEAQLVAMQRQGRHRYYSLRNRMVARTLESLSRVAAVAVPEPRTPEGLRLARTCYDHLAGTLGVLLHDRLLELGWLSKDYLLSASGEAALAKLGMRMPEGRRKFAYACLDWSERRPHLGGALGLSLLQMVEARGWVVRDLDSRALEVTSKGRRELRSRLGIDIVKV